MSADGTIVAMPDSRESTELLGEYNKAFPLYEEFTRRLAELMQSLLDAEGISHSLESRPKDPLHFLEKASRRGKHYADPLFDITDLAGVRVIVESMSSVERVAQVIRTELHVDEARSVDKAELLQVDQFGYLSQHFIVRLKGQRGSSREWMHLSKLWGEIQVRTSLQHAWAQVEHSLVYKPESDLPVDLRRRFHALAAVFELADRELDDLVESGHRLIAKEKAAIRVAQGDVELTTLSMIAYLEESSVVHKLLDLVRDEGVGIGPIGVADRAADMAIHAGVRTVGELDRVLVEAQPWARAFLSRFCNYTWRDVDRSRGSMDVSGIPIIFLIAALPNAFDEETLEGRFRFGQSWRVIRAAAEARGQES